jgi:twitching motility two-component system response regulator PilH
MSIDKVLVVDDSPTELHIIMSYLIKHGFTAISAINGSEALEAAKAQKPDLILMDVVMPGMNGFQATRKLSRNPSTANIPVVIVSAKGQETDKIWGMRQGASQYLVKPVKPAEIIAAVEAALGNG